MASRKYESGYQKLKKKKKKRLSGLAILSIEKKC